MTRTRLLAATLLAAVTAAPAPAATTPITQTVWEGRTTDASGKAAATNATYVDSASPNTAFGTATTFNTGGTATGLLSFPTLFSDLGLNPANITITSAKLDLCVPPSVYATGGQYAGKTPGVVSMYLAAENWSETSTYANTGSNGISTGAAIVSNKQATTAHNTYDITAAVLAWQADPTALARGLVIKTVSGTPVVFASDLFANFGLTNNERPALTLTYTVNPSNPVPAPPAVLLLGAGGLLAAARSFRRRLPPPPAAVA